MDRKHHSVTGDKIHQFQQKVQPHLIAWQIEYWHELYNYKIILETFLLGTSINQTTELALVKLETKEAILSPKKGKTPGVWD